MKLAPILTKYLLENKVLTLPGLGVFYVEYDDGANKRFEQTKSAVLDEKLIDYIAAETGKMRSVANSDLTFQIENIIHFLNTGKPYQLAGIGTLVQKQDGSYQFTAQIEEQHLSKAERRPPNPLKTEVNIIPQSYIDKSRPNPKVKSKKTGVVIFILLVLVAVAASVWFYRNSAETEETPPPAAEAIQEKGNPEKQELPDNAAPTNSTPQIGADGKYTFVLETANAARANKRFNQLKTLNWPVELQTVDSNTFRIIMNLPASAADTSRIKDSLRVLSGRTVSILQ